MSDEILFLPLDANPDLVKGPNQIRPPAGARPPKPGGPGPKQPKIGAAPSGGGAPVPKGNKVGASMPSAKAPSMAQVSGGKEYDYVDGNKPMPKGAEGKTDGGNWKVPKGAGNPKGVMPKDPEAKKPDGEKPGIEDPLTGKKTSELDNKVTEAAHAEKPGADPLAAGGRPSQEPGQRKAKPTQSFDTHSANEADFKDAHPGLHHALAEKFRDEGDDKMAHFHEEQIKQKTKDFTPEQHDQLSEQLRGAGQNSAADKHAGQARDKRVAETRDPANKWVSEVDEEDAAQGKPDPIDGVKVGADGNVSVEGKQAAPDPKKVQSDKQKQQAQKRPASDDEKAAAEASAKAKQGPNGERFDLEEGSAEHKAAMKQGKQEPDAVYRKRMETEHGVVVEPEKLADQHPDIQATFKERQKKVAEDFAKKKAAHAAGGGTPASKPAGGAAPAAGAPAAAQSESGLPEAKPGDPAKTPVADIGKRNQKASKAELDAHKEAGSKAEKELTTKHSEKERALKDSHKARESELKTAHETGAKELAEKHSSKEKELKTKHSEREKELAEKHSSKEKALTEKHESKRSELQSKYDEKLKSHTDDHRAAQDEHEKAKQRLVSVRGKKDVSPAEIKAAQRDVNASKELITESKRKLDDHKANGKAKLDAHKESSTKEMAAHKFNASKQVSEQRATHAEELKTHKERSKFEADTYKQSTKRELETHKQSTARELEDHKASSGKELDEHREKHGAAGKELAGKHEQAVEQDKQEATQAKQEDKAKQKEAKEQEKAAKAEAKAKGQDEATAKANERKAPSNPHEEMQASAHRSKAQKMADNIDSHMKNPDLSPAEKEKLTKTRAMLEDHINSPHVPTPEMQSQLKDVEQAAGEHGKKAHEGVEDSGEGGAKVEPAGKNGLSAMSRAAKQGYAAGSTIGQAATSTYAGALGRHVVQYGTAGAASAGHFLLKQTSPSDREAAAATNAVAAERHKQSGGGDDSGGGSDKETESVSANKSLRLYVRL